MKTRNGFVSNSSTTSFMIYGIALEPDEAKAMMRRDHPKIAAAIVKHGDDEPFEIIEEVFGWSMGHCSEWGEHKYYGISWDSVKDDETGAEFKERVRARLAEVLEGELKLGTHEESWFDG